MWYALRTIALLVCLVPSIVFAQTTSKPTKPGEFRLYDNGLIYDGESIAALKEMAAYRNKAYRECPYIKKYFSLRQTKGVKYVFEGPEEEINKLIKYTSSDFDSLLITKEYGKYLIDKIYLPLITAEIDYEGNELEILNLVVGKNNVSFNSIFKSKLDKDISKYILTERERVVFSTESKYNNYRVTIVFCEKGFENMEMPEIYGKMVLFSECYIDTSDSYEPKTDYRKEVETPALSSFYASYNQFRFPKEPILEDYIPQVKSQDNDFDSLYTKDMEKAWAEFIEAHAVWADNKLTLGVDYIEKNSWLKNLLLEAANESVELGTGTEEIEDLVFLTISKKVASEIASARRVMGACSMDDSPRVHAQRVAVLASQAKYYELFLRAHLNILNDRFDRLSDGSYAFAGRQTYIKELEALDIDVVRLLLGSSLLVENPARNHYYSSPNRLGRAFSETSNPELFEETILRMMSDPGLDPYNQCRMAFIYYCYLANLDNLDLANEKLKSWAELLEGSNTAVELIVESISPFKKNER